MPPDPPRTGVLCMLTHFSLLSHKSLLETVYTYMFLHHTSRMESNSRLFEQVGRAALLYHGHCGDVLHNASDEHQGLTAQVTQARRN